MATHTPGPWWIVQAEQVPGKQVVAAVLGQGRDILVASSSDVASFGLEANARLIAAAPEMYATLTSLRTMLLADVGAKGGLNEASRERVMAAVRAALAKTEA